MLSLKDTADNVAATFTVSNATFDLFTIAPVMTAPETGDYIVTDFVVDFFASGARRGWGRSRSPVSYAASTLAKAVPADTEARVITFSSADVFLLQDYSLTLAQLSTLANTGYTFTSSSCNGNAAHDANQSACEGEGHTFTVSTCRDGNNQDQGGAKRASNEVNCVGKSIVASVLPLVTFDDRVESADLTDGSTYDFTLSMKDAAGNTAATHSQNGVHFVGSSTIAPIVNSPPSNSHIPDEWTLDIVLYERMSTCSLVIDLNTAPRDGRNRACKRRGRSCLSRRACPPGPHQFTMKDISSLPGSMADVQSVTNAIDLVVGAVYEHVVRMHGHGTWCRQSQCDDVVDRHRIRRRGDACGRRLPNPAASSSQRNTFSA